MTLYTVETTYHLPIYRQRRYEAADVEEACRLAIGDEGWEDEHADIDTSGETFVTGIWEHADTAYAGPAVPVPARFQETVERKADLFDELLAVLKEPARPLGLSRRELEDWLPCALDVIARADAIITRS